MRRIAVAVFLAGITLLGAGRTEAQEGQDFSTSKFRVQVADGRNLQGYVRDRSVHELVLVTAEGTEHRVPVAEVRRLEVRSRQGNQLWRGAVVGAFVAGSLILTGAIDAIEDRGRTSGAALGLLGGATVAGAAIGATVPRYGWRATDPRAIGDGGMRLRVTLRF